MGENMEIKKIYRKILIGLFMVNLLAIFFFSYKKLCQSIPDELRIKVNQEENVKLPIFISGVLGDLELKDQEPEIMNAMVVNQKKVDKNAIRINLSEGFSIQSPIVGSYQMEVSLFGLFPIKTIHVDVVEEEYLLPGGFPVGIMIKTNGLLVLGTGIVNGADGLNYEPALNIVKTGDYIQEINGEKIQDKESFIQKIQESCGEQVELTIVRKEEKIKVRIQPFRTVDGEYKLGIWIRDDTQGIGTLTYINKEGEFGALGHGITDTDTGVLMNVLKGNIYKANILQIIKGEIGTPGELVGSISKKETSIYGKVFKNTNQGIFGEWNYSENMGNKDQMWFPIGYKQEVKKGKAFIQCQLEDQMELYEIEIEQIELNSNRDSKGMVIHITDPKLLNLTNGIIQGMSGSPIIQDEKIIGAVTHVFVQDSTRGYGIFIENMLKSMK